MPITANSRVISLADMLQVKGASLGTCRIVIDTPVGPGVMGVVDARIVWAEYDGSVGEPAAYRLLMLDGDYNYELRTDVEIKKFNMDVPCQRFLLSSLRFKESRSPAGQA
jgi:hypothetical protein